MKRKDRALVAANYIEHWQSILGLRDWDIRYQDEQPGNDSWASTRFSTSDRAVALLVDKRLPYMEPQVLHELMHVVLFDYHQLVASLLHHLDRKTTRQVTDLLHDAEERTIEQLVRAFLPDAPRVTVKPKDKDGPWRAFSE